MESNDRYINIKEVVYQTSLSRSTLYYMIERGRFPAAISIGSRAVRWRQSDVDEFKRNPSGYGLRKAMERTRLHCGETA